MQRLCAAVRADRSRELDVVSRGNAGRWGRSQAARRPDGCQPGARSGSSGAGSGWARRSVRSTTYPVASQAVLRRTLTAWNDLARNGWLGGRATLIRAVRSTAGGR